jgi:hypothetical protein
MRELHGNMRTHVIKNNLKHVNTLSQAAAQASSATSPERAHPAIQTLSVPTKVSRDLLSPQPILPCVCPRALSNKAALKFSLARVRTKNVNLKM